MGKYVVNGEVVEVKKDQPTALDLKEGIGSVRSDWVMASLPNGEVLRLNDDEALPSEATDFSIVTPFIYGR
ncbi:hypothetical protein NLX83_01745 [Allokutzneria sp. A3M-2-11 16]|uniref:hypothetical protein n=1 Tax=Allokutzneria sp. A3M-2-11 16 TaxID=2962043 RepID=UPI0020B69DB0|nr:hypothetical protein [Allokutzneria sp. A3M-2-11 16]MCP3797972.1 hypothetical protein [Allokutzneria sp. A3M-2-11 16]